VGLVSKKLVGKAWALRNKLR